MHLKYIIYFHAYLFIYLFLKRGPLEELSSGASLVDLPGFNDTVTARALLTQKYLQNCSFIWVLAGMF